jgi:hypothetical protein
MRRKRRTFVLTEAAVREYVNDGGGHCPFCGGDRLSSGDADAQEASAWLDVACKDCGVAWRDSFALVGIDVLDAEGRYVDTIYATERLSKDNPGNSCAFSGSTDPISIYAGATEPRFELVVYVGMTHRGSQLPGQIASSTAMQANYAADLQGESGIQIAPVESHRATGATVSFVGITSNTLPPKRRGRPRKRTSDCSAP